MSDMNDMIASISKQSNTFDEAVKILSLDVLRQACERNANLAVELAAMTQESDALRRENEQQRKVIRLMSIRCAVYCSWAYKCTKQPVDGRFDKETCYQCQTEKYKQQAAQAGKDGV